MFRVPPPPPLTT
uniref:Uncharacterized protein n=1 Tax=Anguilla anguilla TaxID=7936 RepID=A0A0E9RSZ5_ANGAN